MLRLMQEATYQIYYIVIRPHGFCVGRRATAMTFRTRSCMKRAELEVLPAQRCACNRAKGEQADLTSSTE